MKKLLFLVLTLAIPVSIFLFLKYFGSNEFEVPLLFENGIDGCPQSRSPHVVPHPHSATLEPNNPRERPARFLVYCQLNEDDKHLSERIIQLIRIQDAFYEVGSPMFIVLTNETSIGTTISGKLAETGMLKENVLLQPLRNIAMQDFLQCGLGLIGEKDKDKLVLVDRNGHIRGIYDGLKMEQTELLILELKILKQEENNPGDV
jgi:protein SCO1/2